MSNKPYYQMEHVTSFRASFWFMLKIRIFGKKIQERAGNCTATWYAYKGKLYMTDYSAY